MMAGIPSTHTHTQMPKQRCGVLVGSQCTPSSGRGVSILLVCGITIACIRGICISSAGALRAVFWATGETESTPAASGPFRKTRSAWSCFAARPSTDDGNFVESSAEDVEDKVVDEQRRPGPDADEA
jgi:hypothetical protein